MANNRSKLGGGFVTRLIDMFSKKNKPEDVWDAMCEECRRRYNKDLNTYLIKDQTNTLDVDDSRSKPKEIKVIMTGGNNNFSLSLNSPMNSSALKNTRDVTPRTHRRNPTVEEIDTPSREEERLKAKNQKMVDSFCFNLDSVNIVNHQQREYLIREGMQDFSRNKKQRNYLSLYLGVGVYFLRGADRQGNPFDLPNREAVLHYTNEDKDFEEKIQQWHDTDSCELMFLALERGSMFCNLGDPDVYFLHRGLACAGKKKDKNKIKNQQRTYTSSLCK